MKGNKATVLLTISQKYVHDSSAAWRTFGFLTLQLSIQLFILSIGKTLQSSVVNSSDVLLASIHSTELPQTHHKPTDRRMHRRTTQKHNGCGSESAYQLELGQCRYFRSVSVFGIFFGIF